MAMILPTTNKVQIVRLTKALFDAAPGYTYLSAFEGAVAEMGTGTAGMNAFANWLSSVVSTNPATLTATMVASLHLTGATATAFTAFFTSAFASVTPAQYGQTILAGLNGLANIPSTDATWGATANAFNTSVANSYVFSTNTANTTVDLPTLLAADEVNPLSPAITLTTAFDNLLGTANPDSFYAYIRDNANTLQSGDKIDGGAGVDVLWADMGTSSNFAVTPETVSVEEIRIRAEAVPGDSKDGNNMTQNVQIDAQRMSGVTLWASDNSRSDVIIEDVRINSNISTIEFKESDPGNVDLGVYFNQRNLVNTTGGSSALNIMVMDTYAAGTAATAATPLLALNFNAYSYYAVPTGGTAQLIILGGAGTAAGNAMLAAKTYTAMQAAFQLALQTASVNGVITDLSSSVTVSLGALTNFTTLAAASTTSAPVAASFLGLSGQVITMTTSVPGITISTTGAPGSPAAGWIAAGPAPITGSIVQTYSTGATSSAALVNTNIILDDVGMGSTGGDLLVGGMSTGDTSTSKGVERFNITVKDNSKVQTINSTDNTLREVVIVNGTTSSESTAYVTTTKDAGDLTVNGNALGQTVSASNQTMAGANTGATAVHQGVGAAGFTDVRLINASAMTGKFAFTAAITSDSIAKYIPLADTQADPYADIATDNTVGLGANFDYKGGNNNDTMSVTIDGDVAASRSRVLSGHTDFTFSIDGGAGNDAITVDVVDSAPTTLVGGIENWAANQDLNDNITITAGAGNDTIRIPGTGDTKILAGAGNDTIYTDNTGIQTGLTVGTGASITALGTGTSSNGIWVFNTYDQANAIANGNARNIYDLRSDDNTSYNLYKATLTVTFKNIPSVTITLANSTTYKTTDLEINQAIKNAINTDPTLSKLLLAQDGPGNTLIVTSLIDGAMTTGDLTVTLAAATAELSAAELASVNTAWGTAIVTGGYVANQAATLATYTTNGDYVTQMAQDAAGVNIVGAASTSTSDNFITPGTDNDVIVLGTTVGVDVARSSNEVITLEAGFGNDVILNFATTGNGIDHLNVGTAFLGGGTTATLTGTLITTNNLVTVVASVAGTNDTDALVSALIKAADTTTAAASKQVYVVYSASNVGKIYSVVNGAAIGDATATLQGTIDLGDVAWTALNTDAHWRSVGAQAEGASSAVMGPVLTAAVASQILVGTTSIDQFNTNGFTGVSMTGLAGNDVFTITTGSTGSIITDLTTGDIINVAGTGALAATTAAFVATNESSHTGSGAVTLTGAAAGSVINMAAAVGSAGYGFVGGAAADTFTGSAFADTFITNTAGDIWVGNAGNDNFNASAAVAGLTITGGTGTDLFNISGATTGVVVTDLATEDYFTIAAAASSVTFNNVSSFTAGTNSTNANATGNTAVILNAAATASTIDMTLAGGTVGYSINGGAGADTLKGSAFADIVKGGVGADTITLGAGADHIVVSEIATVDTVTDFSAANVDIMDFDLSDLVTAAGLVLKDGGSVAIAAGAATAKVILAAPIVVAAGDGIFSMEGVTYANAAAFETAIEAAGASQITLGAASTIGDDYMFIWSDGANAHVGYYTAATAAVTFAAAGTYTELVTLTGISTTAAVAALNADFAYIA